MCVRAPVCRHVLFMCTVCVGAQHICVWGVGGGLVVGHGLGAWGQRWAGRCRWELPVGSLLWWHLWPTSAHSPTWMQHGAHTRSLGGVSPPFPLPCEEAGPARAPPITNDRDGRTRSSRPTLQECASGASGAAPPAGSLGRRSRATSGLSLQITALRSTRFLALPWALASMWP